MTDNPRLEIVATSFTDPRVDALRVAKDDELEPRYEEHARATGARARFEPEIDPASVRLALVALVDGTPAGSVLMREIPGKYEVKRLIVLPEFRGLGIARALLTRVEDDARARGADTLWLHTGILQPDAIRLYEKSGWTLLPEPFPPYENDGVSLCYSKPLTPS